VIDDPSFNKGLREGVPKVNGLLRYFFETMGRTLHVDDKSSNLLTSSHTTSFSHNYRDGHIMFADSCEIIMLLRHLMSVSPDWLDALSPVILDSLKRIPSLVDPHKSILSETGRQRSDLLYYVLSALSLVGGHTDGLRVGGRVEVKATKERGVLVDFDRKSSKAKLILDANPRKVIECDSSKVDALPELPVDSEKFSLDTELISALIVFLNVPQEVLVGPAQQEPKKAEEAPQPIAVVEEEEEEEEKVVEEPPPPPISFEQWACEVCTLLNEPTAMTCAVCESPNPNPISRPPPRQSPAKKTKKAPAKVPPKKEEEEEKEEALIYADTDVLYQQLRSRSIRALCTLMDNPAASAFIAKAGVLSTLLSTAVTPTNLEEFKSLAQLESREARLLELLLQFKMGMEEERGPEQSSQAEVLEYSPFKGQPVTLPSAFDRSTARHVAFAKGNLCNIVGRISDLEVERVGISRANAVIPNSLPAFYFEIKLCKGDGEDDEDFDWEKEAKQKEDKRLQLIEAENKKKEAEEKPKQAATETPPATPTPTPTTPPTGDTTATPTTTGDSTTTPATPPPAPKEEKKEEVLVLDEEDFVDVDDISDDVPCIALGLFREGFALQVSKLNLFYFDYLFFSFRVYRESIPAMPTKVIQEGYIITWVIFASPK